MTVDEHCKFLGKLMANFQSLEFFLRAFLQELPSARPIGISYGTDIYSFPVGTELPESEFTSYDSLGLLIQKFNGEMQKQGLSIVDATLVEVRDALAHGRVSSGTADGDLRLLKFARPKSGRVRVTFNQRMDEAWFKTEIGRVQEAVRVVYKAISQ